MTLSKSPYYADPFLSKSFIYGWIGWMGWDGITKVSFNIFILRYIKHITRV